VHRICLNDWRSANARAFTTCTVCGFTYVVRAGPFKDKAWRRYLKFSALLLRDALLALGAAALAIYAIGRAVVFVDNAWAWCMPECQLADSPAPPPVLPRNEPFIGPTCQACAPFQTMVFSHGAEQGAALSVHLTSWALGSTVVFAVRASIGLRA
jgi:hypothetical protein